jgi:sarcosine dehydrogenase
MSTKEVLAEAKYVIVGGGIVGCSIAYHLAKMGIDDVLVIEKGELTSGSTWHAAGLVGQLRSSRNITAMLKYSVELYGKLEAETGLATGWRTSGGLRLACSEARMIENQKAATMAKSFGLEMHMLTPQEAYDLFPIMNLQGVKGAAYLPTDGYADPSMITHALARGARNGGVTIKRGLRVTGVKVDNKNATELQTDQGIVKAEFVINAAGMWAREFGAMAGVNVPLIAVEHQFMVTEPISGLPKNLPTMRDPDNLIYYKQEVGGLVMGGYEPNPIAWSTQGIPTNFGQELLESKFDHFEQLANKAIFRTPCLETAGVARLINGPESFTPDGHFIMGPAPELKNYFVAAGFNAHGIAAGGGAGKMMAEWIVEGRPSLDMWDADISRFGEYHKSLKYVTDRTLELYGKHYAIAWPHEEHQSARPNYKSPLYDSLKAAGAVFGAKAGWERPLWFAPNGVEARDQETFGTPNWFDHVGNEHRAIREKVALIDQTSFSKFQITGNDALAFLQRVAVANVDRPVGALIYTQLCNEGGGIVADLTFMRDGENDFYMVTGTAFGNHDHAWLQENIYDSEDVTITKVSEQYGVLNVCGPLSRELLSCVTSSDMSNKAHAFATYQTIEIATKTLKAARVTYVGELGWELHIPIADLQAVYDALWSAGQDFGVTNAGYRAIESCRLEKGYRYWSTDLTPDYSPYDAGLGFCIATDKEDFLGKQALTEIKATGSKLKLITLTINEPIILLGKECIYLNNKVVGTLTSGGFGYTVGKNIALGYVPRDLATSENFEIECLGKRYQTQRHKGSVYDPKRARILC